MMDKSEYIVDPPRNPNRRTYYIIIDPVNGESYGHTKDFQLATLMADAQSRNFHIMLTVEKRETFYVTS